MGSVLTSIRALGCYCYVSVLTVSLRCQPVNVKFLRVSWRHHTDDRQTGQWSVREDYQWTADSIIVQWTFKGFHWQHTHTYWISCQFVSLWSSQYLSIFDTYSLHSDGPYPMLWLCFYAGTVIFWETLRTKCSTLIQTSSLALAEI